MTRLAAPLAAVLALGAAPVAAAPGISVTGTAGVAAPARTVRVVAAGDLACATDNPAFNAGRGTGLACRQAATARAAAAVNPSVVLTLGDNQYEDGRLAQFRRSFDPTWGRFLDRRPARNRLWPVPGNHDYGNGAGGTSRAQGYFAYFNGGSQSRPAARGVAGRTGRGWYERRIGRWQLIALNSNCDYARGVACGRSSPQYRWLERRLASSGARCTLATWHHPLFTSGAEHTGDPRMRIYWRLLHRYRVELVLTGHNHDYERFAPADARGRPSATGPREFVVGTGGRSLYDIAPRTPAPQVADDSTMGVLALDLGRTGYSWQFVPASFPGNGTFTDAGSGTCLR